MPYLAGIAFLAAWAWQAVAAYRTARALQPAREEAPERSPAVAIGWLSLPLLAWATGFWLVAADAATPAATVDRFVTDWSAGALAEDDRWPAGIIAAAIEADAALDPGAERLRDIRFSVIEQSGDRARAVADAVHYERRPSAFLGIFAGTELVPVADERILTLELAAVPVELPGGGDIGAVRWELVQASGS